MTSQEAFDLAVSHHRAGRLHEAAQLYRQMLAQNAGHGQALQNLGVIAIQSRDFKAALDWLGLALAINPESPGTYNNLGSCLFAVGRNDEAIAAFHRAISLDPALRGAHKNLGYALVACGRIEQGIAAFQKEIALHPDFADAHLSLGNTLRDARRPHEAVASIERSIALDPANAQAYRSLGNVLEDRGRLDEAIDAYRRATELDGRCYECFNELGLALKEAGHFNQAISVFRQAITLKPDFAPAHNNLAYTLIGQGDFISGWQELEWRFACNLATSPRRSFAQPQWDGQALNGATLLIVTEQGLGDTLQFIRYLPLIAGRNARIVIECQEPLRRLFALSPHVHAVVSRGQPLPSFDFHCATMSLPRIFGTTLLTVPSDTPYLHADPSDIAAWKNRAAAPAPIMKVGLVWSGDPNNPSDRNRSIALRNFLPILQLSNVLFFSLQKGAASADLKTLPANLSIVDHTDLLHDFADTASLIANLDLVISVDTAVAHLAGAMGREVWTLLPSIPDWRWLPNREKTPWYPSMTLFRQSNPGDWAEVIQRVVDALSLRILVR